MLKKLSQILLVFLLLLGAVYPVQAAETKKNIYFFWSRTCPHCAREKVFLQELAAKYPRLEIQDFEISASQENLELFKKVGEKFSASGHVPFTVIGEYPFIGYLDDQTTGKQMEEAVRCYLADGCEDIVKNLLQPATEKASFIPETISLPLLGEIRIKNLSLPALTFVIALLDGFNPCAMWVLLFLISLLLGMKDRKKMWVLGTTFILTSGIVYFLFLSAWLNLFLFLGFVLGVRIMVGFVALGAGGYSLRDFWINREGGCETVEEKKRKKTFAKIKQTIQKKNFLLALGGIVLLALAVNLIEFVCSAGLPAVYTQILALTKLPRWQYYLYLLFYILVFMLDDLFIFLVAMMTLRAVGIESKYARYSRLVGGILIFVIGLLLLFKPEWLMFG